MSNNPKTSANKNLQKHHWIKKKNYKNNLVCNELEHKLVFKNFQSIFFFIFSSHASELKKFKKENGIKG
jgi:hypothetical protein